MDSKLHQVEIRFTAFLLAPSHKEAEQDASQQVRRALSQRGVHEVVAKSVQPSPSRIEAAMCHPLLTGQAWSLNDALSAGIDFADPALDEHANRVRQIEARLLAAGDEPWRAMEDGDFDDDDPVGTWRIEAGPKYESEDGSVRFSAGIIAENLADEDSARFIAFAPADIRWLLARVKAAL